FHFPSLIDRANKHREAAPRAGKCAAYGVVMILSTAVQSGNSLQTGNRILSNLFQMTFSIDRGFEFIIHRSGGPVGDGHRAESRFKGGSFAMARPAYSILLSSICALALASPALAQADAQP